MPGPVGPPARLVLAAGRERAGRAGRGRCLFTSGRGAPQPLPSQLPEVCLLVSVPAAPWIPATSSPAAGRGTWAECGEDPAAPEGAGGATPSEASRGRPRDGLALRHQHPAHRRPPVNRRLGAEAGGRPGTAAVLQTGAHGGAVLAIYSGRSRRASWRRRLPREAQRRSGRREEEVCPEHSGPD